MLQISHIINPFIAPESSDLYTAQPITFESMRRAKNKAQDIADIRLFSAQYEEDISIVPEDFIPTPHLTKSVLDNGTFSRPIKLPFIGAILDRLYDASDADYFIYTNVDIVLHSDFYIEVAQHINDGYDAFIINRRRISDEYTRIDQLDVLQLEKGKKHPGFDCFVFARHLYPKFNLAEICIGVPFIGITLAQNLFCFAKNFRLFEEEFITFHIGMEVFPKRAPRDYFNYNRKEFWKAMNGIKKDHDASKLPYFNHFLFYRIIKYGLHPSIPIRWVLVLEFKRIQSWFK